MGIDIDFDILKEAFLSHLEEFKNFHFSFLNPLFWVFLLAICLILLRYWEAKKSFSFCLIIGILLLLTTKLEGYLVAMFGDTAFLPFITRLFSLFIISIIFLYYAVIKDT